MTHEEEDQAIIEKMMKQVRWEMNWTDMKQRFPDNTRLKATPDIEQMFEKEIALAVLLFAYSKSVQEDLTQEEKKAALQMMQEIKRGKA